MMQDLINDAVANIRNYSRIGKPECTVQPTSKLLIEMLRIFQKNGYIGEFEVAEDRRGGQVKIQLKPRFPAKYSELDRWEKRYLPSRDFGIIIMSTPKGIMTHKEAKEIKSGGRLIAYIY
jgi:small subunit ribosomal protein S8